MKVPHIEPNKIVFFVMMIMFIAIFIPALSNIAIAGLPGPEDLIQWYVPENLRNKEQDPSPGFPAVSQYSVFLNYTSKTRMAIWYFTDPDELEKGEKELCEYLKEHGNVSCDTLVIPGEIQDYNSETISSPISFNITRYDSKETSGYFEVFKNPFYDRIDSYFILYYGNNGKSLEEDDNRIKNVMIKEYYRKNIGGHVRGLDDCITDQKCTEVITAKEEFNNSTENISNAAAHGTLANLLFVALACMVVGKKQ